METRPIIFTTSFLKNDNESKNDIDLFNSALKNSIKDGIIKKDNQNFYFLIMNKFVKCDILRRIINLDNDKHYSSLFDMIVKVMQKSHIVIQNIPDADGIIGGNFGLRDKHSTNEETIVNSILCKMTNEYGKRTILYLISQIIFKINANHIYNNGNKRTSILTAAIVLKFFGYDIIHRSIPHELIKTWEKWMLKVANYKNESDLKNENNTIKFISKIIKKVIIFDRLWNI